METQFENARNGGVMTKIKGKTAFPERNSSEKPRPGETWNVEIVGENPRRTVYFIRLLCKVETAEQFIRNTVSEHPICEYFLEAFRGARNDESFREMIRERYTEERVRLYIDSLDIPYPLKRSLKYGFTVSDGYEAACETVRQKIRDYTPPQPKKNPYQFSPDLETHRVCPKCGNRDLVINMTDPDIPEVLCRKCNIASSGKSIISPCVICGGVHENLLGISNIPEWNEKNGSGSYAYVPGFPNTGNICPTCEPELKRRANAAHYE